MKYTLFVICRFVSARLLFTVLLFSLGQSLFSEDIILHYDSVYICQGDSFPIQTFLDNQVEVPVNCRLIGCENISTSYLKPTGDTILHLLYTKLEVPDSVFRKPLKIWIRSKPLVRVMTESTRVCAGVPLPDIEFLSQDCDKIYWQEEKSGREVSNLSDLGNVPYGVEQIHLLLVGSNEQCPEVVYDEYEVAVIDPTRFHLSLTMPPDEVSICGDSMLLCEYVKPSIVKLYYGDDLQERYYDHPSIVTWEKEDGYTMCDSFIGESYENQYHITTSIEEPVCHTEITFSESHLLKLFCTGKSEPTYSVSYSCTAGNGVIYIGADQPLVDATFRSLSGATGPIPKYKNTTEYNMETYKFPYRGCAVLCWDDEGKSNERYEVVLTCVNELGDTLFIHDTLDVSKCKTQPPMVQYECSSSERRTFFYVSSMDSILSVTFNTEEYIPLYELNRVNETQKKYNHFKTYFFEWTDAISDFLDYLITLKYLGCGSDTMQTAMNMAVKNCSPTPRLYYGAYLYPSSILLKKEDCQSHQCSNQPDQDPSMVSLKLNCYNDTVYLKFKGVDFDKKDSYELTIHSKASVSVVYPYEYQVVGDGHFRFYNVDVMNPTVCFVPTEDCVIEGDMEGVRFLFSIEIAQQVVQTEYTICQGDTLDLQTLVKDAGSTLRWNVSNTMVSPMKDTEYYLYGFTETGCLVDEKVRIHIDYPIWLHTDDKTLCDSSYVECSSILHTNAQKMVWYENDEEVGEERLFIKKGNEYRVDLFSVCDTQSYRLNLEIEKCEEDSLTDTLDVEIPHIIIPAFFTPDGDGVDDYWQVVENCETMKGGRCRIYDRFGKLVAEYQSREILWDGTYKGIPQPTTDYWYVIEIVGQEPIVGHFTLRR